MSVGKVGLNALGRLGSGLGSVKTGIPGTPPELESFIILENDAGYILLEDSDLIVTET